MRDLLKTEDWWATWIGLFILVLGLSIAAGSSAQASGADLLGWSAKTSVWIDPSAALGLTSPTYHRSIAPAVGLLLTFGFLLAILSVGAAVMGHDLRRFIPGFTVVFWVSYACWFLGHNAYVAATPNEQAKFGVGWSMGLTGEAGYVLALLVGLGVGNFVPGLSRWLRDAARSEWFIKTAIVILGAVLAVKAADAAANEKLTRAIFFRGFAAIVEAYLIYWALVYWIARRFFGFSREWAAPLASGISICGVSAAIATGAAIRARPIVPIMVSSLVVVFAVVELLVLPFCAQHFLYHEPMVAGAWLGLAVKTDGAAIASGAIADGLVLAQAQKETGVQYQADWLLTTTTTVKVFIDVFIGIWAFVLSIVWVYYVNPKKGERVRLVEIWQRFPKFVLGYFLAFAVLFIVARQYPDRMASFKQATGEADAFRTIFFAMTFFSIGLAADFKRLWQEGIGRLAVVYVVSLFGFIVWIGLAISWIFFHGVMPPKV